MGTAGAPRRIVITGWGAVTPLGLTVEETWSAMLRGCSGIAELTTVDTTGLTVRIGGEVRGFNPEDYMPRTVSRRLDSFAQYAVGAAQQAVEHAKFTIGPDEADRVGVLIGSGYGAANYNQQVAHVVRDRSPRAVSPFSQVTGAIDSAVGEVTMRIGAQGPSRAQSTACATGTDSIGEAARWIRYGIADVVVAGGAESCLNRADLAGSANARALSTRNDDPTRASRPFDAARDGFVMSSGAGVLVLEELEHALRRGVPILAEVSGYGSTSDAYHLTAPHPEAIGARKAMRLALEDAGVDSSDVDYINAHGTSTPIGDEREVYAIRSVLGARASAVPVSSTKSMTGHMLGAGGAVEAIVCALAMRDSVVPPTVNLDDPLDAEMNFVPNVAQEHEVRVAVSNSFGFGGHNAVLVLSAWEH
ncbi:beta-ketoacyl-ACP synthase II [Kutzneria sp. 744]|uniref:beta-ketoacyl-ACP synthase II n=1 Tax=Kutzneria sp. (strain 744) TaxID=345341 RepID=UPI0003EECBFC|nr:beta-ketoacyl-ACP synthase II [Kutzneria sp. 744]EWM11119.1 beta-ketoacyl-[acyl-carrier-protein] synthase II [Kutzneria sp. 744]